VSYPDGQQTPDGKLCMIWDFVRSREHEIWMTTLCEEDMLAANDEAVVRVKASS